MVAVLLVDVGFGDLHSTKDPAMDLYIIQMSKLILQSAKSNNWKNRRKNPDRWNCFFKKRVGKTNRTSG